MIKFFITKKKSTILLSLFLLGAGIFTFFNLPIKLYPKIVKPSFRVSFGHSNLKDPKEAYNQYGKDLYNLSKQIKGFESATTEYYGSWNRFNVDYIWNSDEDEILSEFKSHFESIKSADRKFWYHIRSKSEKEAGSFRVIVASNQLDKAAIQTVFNEEYKSKINSIEGVSSVRYWGGTRKKLTIVIDKDKQFYFGVSIGEIVNKIKESFKTKRISQIARGRDWSNRIDIVIPKDSEFSYQLEQLKIKEGVKLKDLSKIETVYEEEESLGRYNGDDAIFVGINLDAQADLWKVYNQLNKITKDSANNDLRFEVIINPYKFVKLSLNNLIFNTILGGILAVFIIFFFLRDLTSTICISTAIPMSLITSFLLMGLFDVTINIISLGGLALGIGMVLDNSIVVLENIKRHIGLSSNNLQIEDIISESTKEVIPPLFTSTLTSVMVFLPLAFTESYTKAILGDLTKTIVFTLLISFPVSTFLVPTLFSLLYKRPKIIKNELSFSLITKILTYLLSSKIRSIFTLLIVILTLASTFLLVPKIKKEIVAVPKTNLMDINLSISNATTVAMLDKKIRELEKNLQQFDEIKNIAAFVWSEDNGEVKLELTDPDDYEDLKEKILSIYEDDSSVSLYVSKWNPGKMPIPRVNDKVIRITSSATQETIDSLKEIEKELHEIDGTNTRLRPHLNFKSTIHLIKNKNVSLDFREANFQIEAMSKDGHFVNEYSLDGSLSKSLYIGYKKEQRLKTDYDLKKTNIILDGVSYPISSFYDILEKNETTIPLRLIDDQYAYDIEVNIRKKKNVNKDESLEKVDQIIKQYTNKHAINLSIPDPSPEITKSQMSFVKSVVLSIIIIYLLMAFLFNSIRLPIYILATLPLALIGVIFGLYIFESTISLNSMLGSILLVGLVVNNAILIIDFYNSSNKTTSKERLIEAVTLRIRPILMTTLTTLFGIIPLMLGLGESGDILRPLGVSVFSGLFVSTLLTVFIIPILVNLLHFDYGKK